MKKVFIIAAIAATVTLSGCANIFGGAYAGGALYTQQTVPVDVRDNATACNKRGTAMSTNILGLVATGDAGIQAAKKAGNITKVGSVDVNYTSILGLFSKSETVVCGE